MSMIATLLPFIFVYVAMGFGKIPGLQTDRTAAAIVGAIAMVVVGSITVKAAWSSISYDTVGMLFGLMIVSGAFAISGAYAHVAVRVARLNVPPSALLAILAAVAGGLSALLTNDVVVVAMTPLLVSATIARGLNPVPFLLAFCFAANNGSSGTLIGSPQNMIIAQSLNLSFNGFIVATAIPAFLSIFAVWGVVAYLYRGRWFLDENKKNEVSPTLPDINLTETIKAIIVTLGVIVAFAATQLPRELVALGAGGFLLLNRKIPSGDILKQVDGKLLLLIMGLYVVNAALASTGLTTQMLDSMKETFGFDLKHPFTLFVVGGILSDIVGNNPAVMMLSPLLGNGGDHPYQLGAAMALGTGFSSNLLVFGSLAGIIVVEQASLQGVKISFWEFSRAGIPVALASLSIASLWLYYGY